MINGGAARIETSFVGVLLVNPKSPCDPKSQVPFNLHCGGKLAQPRGKLAQKFDCKYCTETANCTVVQFVVLKAIFSIFKRLISFLNERKYRETGDKILKISQRVPYSP